LCKLEVPDDLLFGHWATECQAQELEPPRKTLYKSYPDLRWRPMGSDGAAQQQIMNRLGSFPELWLPMTNLLLSFQPEI
jgi:hypothetical protein